MTKAGIVAIVLLASAPVSALDCAQVQTLIDAGKRPADVARELGLTTPDVQACLAGAVERPAPPRHQVGTLPIAPLLQGESDSVRRMPNQ